MVDSFVSDCFGAFCWGLGGILEIGIKCFVCSNLVNKRMLFSAK